MVVQKRGTFLVVLVLFLLVFAYSISAETVGCYIYPKGSEDLYCVQGVLDVEAQADCDDNSDCNMDQHFVPGSDCSEFLQCEEITCNVDCQLHSRGYCEQLGGSEVPAVQYALWCSQGCCKVADKFCQFNLNKFQCEDKAKKLGFSTYDVFDNSLGMTTAQCNQLYCGVEVAKAGLSGTVKDQSGQVLESADVSLEGTGIKFTTPSAGTYSFPTLNPGTYLVKVTALNYLPTSLTISLLPGQQLTKEIVLVKQEGVGTVKGEVKDQTDNIIQGVTISWNGHSSGQQVTDTSGIFTVTGIPKGNYVFTASKIGFQLQQQDVIVSENAVSVHNFQLTSTVFQGVQGKTYLDNNKNKKPDTGEEQFGAKIYIDNIFKGYSQYSSDGSKTGDYKISLLPGEHTLLATHADYSSGPIKFTVESGKAAGLNVPLNQFVGECSSTNPKDVPQFSAGHVKGKEEVMLQWQKPCPEVLNYIIKKHHEGVQTDQFTVSPSETLKLDAKVEWGQTYKYEILAVYDKGTLSKKAAVASITLGDSECENRYSETTGWDLFCSVEASLRKSILSCNNENKLIATQDCSVQDGETQVWFCAEVGQHNAVCKDAGICSVQFQGADPFGLYYTRDQCYGSDEPEVEGAANYCYYDYSDTIVNQCQQCDTVTGCFDYKSKDACAVNNCLGAECEWVDSAATNPMVDYSKLFSGLNIPTTVTPETGTGYCVEKDYEEDDQCSLCGKQGNLFENYYCTDQVCSSLGACFSNSVTKDKPLSYCASCGDQPTAETNCYTYQFESECTGGQNLEKNDRQEITLSKDQCSWGRCVWDGISGGPGTCMKDGDGDIDDDCARFTNAGERLACRKDNAAPTTKIVSSGQTILSLTTPNITFQAKDEESPLGKVGVCLTSAAPGSSSLCTNFQEKAYPGKLKDETLSVNVLASLQKEVPGETYVLKYYSKDKYFNQENVQTAFIYVDNVPPQFEINQEIKTVGDKTTLSVYLEGTAEPMQCLFTVQQLVPAGATQAKTVEKAVQKKEAIFKDLQGLKFGLNVSCEDNQGNTNIKQEIYTFDLEERINFVQPELYGVAGSSSVTFEVETIAGASCDLYLSATNQKVADFISDENGKKHKTNPVPGFIEKEYAGEYKVVCIELFTEQTYEDFFHFNVDFSAPDTIIILKEGARIAKPKGFGWEEFFVRYALIDFECPQDGFDCDKTYYCLGEGCELINSPAYQEYIATFSVNQSSEICYYSTDVANNPVYQPICGKIRIEGYGVTLEKPLEYRYGEEKWGISNTRVFPLQFYTKVPTSQCKFDFTSGFNYDALPSYKILNPNAEGKYLIENFPTDVFSEYSNSGGIKPLYVQCKSLEGEIGPEQKLNLEYDPTAPVIESVSANPKLIVEGITTTLAVETDDKTVCRYSDNSEGSGSNEYGTMEFSFSGAERNELALTHEAIFNINFLGAKKEYSLNIQCKNGAGDLSEVEEITFVVDYAALGGIVAITPSGYIGYKNVTLIVETSKRAICEYKSGLEYTAFPSGANTNIHSAALGTLLEKKYIIPIRCSIGEHSSEASAVFTVDLSPPSIQNVNDGSFSCGASEMKVLVSTNEENISGYYYEVYDLGESKSFVSTLNQNISNSSTGVSSISFSSSSGSLVFNATVGPGLPIRVPTTNLAEGHKYNVKVLAIDGAGNVATKFAQGDGFLATSSSYPACQNDTGSPGINVVINDSIPGSCTSTPVELECEDTSGCSIVYGKASSASLCRPTLAYNGQKVLFDTSGWLCYSVEDSAGNNYTGSEKITLLDLDGDKVLDSCDQCSGTKAGKVVDEFGCARGQIPISERSKDNDKDGLPDLWEKTFNQELCEFDYTSADSNADGISDTLEDYDEDDYSSYEEYTNELDPCIKDAHPEETEIPQIRTSDGSSNALAWIFLLLGLLLVLGGIGYLVYFYKYAPRGVQRSSSSRPSQPSTRPTAPIFQPRKMVDSWADKFASLRREREERGKERNRRAIFGEFSRDSAQIPHLEPILRTTGEHLSKVGMLAKKYVEHKEEIKPGLRLGERGVFAKLERIAEQTKEKPIHEVLDKNEAKDVFEKLRQLSKKRKE